MAGDGNYKDMYSKSRRGPLPAGTKAPEFTLRSTPDQWLTLNELQGRPVILAFYPADWSPVCGDQMTLYQAALPEFQRYDAQLLGISVDGVWCHLAFAVYGLEDEEWKIAHRYRDDNIRPDQARQ